LRHWRIASPKRVFAMVEHLNHLEGSLPLR